MNYDMKNETCQNCGCTIGKLEPACVFRGNVVCQNCYQKLTNTEDKQPQTETKEKAGAKSNKFLVVCGLILILLVAFFALPLVVKLVIRRGPPTSSNSLQTNSDGVPQDYTEAVKWTKAAEQGDAQAQTWLGAMYYDGKDYKEAVKWLTKAAEQGDPKAQFWLGKIYEDGKGVIENYTEAIKWYKKASEQGYATAQYFLGSMYDIGEGVPQDYYEAVKWYTKAAEQNNAYAQKILGVMYCYGQGVDTWNYKEAYKWVLLAQMNGVDVSEIKENLTSKMTSAQIAEAQKLAKEFVERQEKKKSKRDTSVSDPK